MCRKCCPFYTHLRERAFARQTHICYIYNCTVHTIADIYFTLSWWWRATWLLNLACALLFGTVGIEVRAIVKDAVCVRCSAEINGGAISFSSRLGASPRAEWAISIGRTKWRNGRAICAILYMCARGE